MTTPSFTSCAAAGENAADKASPIAPTTLIRRFISTSFVNVQGKCGNENATTKKRNEIRPCKRRKMSVGFGSLAKIVRFDFGISGQLGADAGMHDAALLDHIGPAGHVQRLLRVLLHQKYGQA